MRKRRRRDGEEAQHFPDQHQDARRREARAIEAELDHMLYELARDKLTPDDPEPEPEPEHTVPTEAGLRAQARELGIPVPRAREGTAERFRDDMLELLSATPEPVATESLPLPVQIARASSAEDERTLMGPAAQLAPRAPKAPDPHAAHLLKRTTGREVWECADARADLN